MPKRRCFLWRARPAAAAPPARSPLARRAPCSQPRTARLRNLPPSERRCRVPPLSCMNPAPSAAPLSDSRCRKSAVFRACPRRKRLSRPFGGSVRRKTARRSERTVHDFIHKLRRTSIIHSYHSTFIFLPIFRPVRPFRRGCALRRTDSGYLRHISSPPQKISESLSRFLSDTAYLFAITGEKRTFRADKMRKKYQRRIDLILPLGHS